MTFKNNDLKKVYLFLKLYSNLSALLYKFHQEKCQYFFVSFFVFFVFFMPFKSQVGLLSKDMACKVQKVRVKVQKDRKNTKKDNFKKTK